MSTSTWTTSDSALQFRESVKSLLEHIPSNHIIEVDHRVRNAGEDLASPSQGYLVLWAQLLEDPHLYAVKIKFDDRLKNALRDVTRENGRYLEYRVGVKVVKFLFEFTMLPVNIPPAEFRPGGISSTDVGETA